MPENPSLLVFEPFDEEISKGIDRRLTGKAIIKGLVILVRFEPEFVCVREEYSAKKKKEENEAKRGLGHNRFWCRCEPERSEGVVISCLKVR